MPLKQGARHNCRRQNTNGYAECESPYIPSIPRGRFHHLQPTRNETEHSQIAGNEPADNRSCDHTENYGTDGSVFEGMPRHVRVSLLQIIANRGGETESGPTLSKGESMATPAHAGKENGVELAPLQKGQEIPLVSVGDSR